jgi:hypothetical protein
MMMGEARPPSTSTAFMLPKVPVTKIIYCQRKSSVADPDPGSGMETNQDPGLTYQFLESLETDFRAKNKDSYPGSGIFLTLDPGSGWKNSDSGSGINIPDPQHCDNLIR